MLAGLLGTVPTMQDRKKRRYHRKSFERVAALYFADGSPATKCEVLDISDGGARLRPMTGSPKALPEKFILVLSTCGKVRRNCRVIWRSAAELGVQFPQL